MSASDLLVNVGAYKKVRRTVKLRRTNELVSEGTLSDSFETPIKLSKFKKQGSNSFLPPINDLKDMETNIVNMKKRNKAGNTLQKPTLNLKLLKSKIEAKRMVTSTKKINKPKLCGVRNGKGVKTTKNGWNVKIFSETSDETDEDKENLDREDTRVNDSILKNSTFIPSNASSPFSSQDNEKCSTDLEPGSTSSHAQRRARLSRCSKSVSSNSDATKSMSIDLDDTSYTNQNLFSNLSSKDTESINLPSRQMLKGDVTFDVPKKASNCLNLTWTLNVSPAVNTTFRISNTKRSLSCNNLDQQEQSENVSTSGVRKRSTLTLEDSVNDIFLLKSGCNSDGTPKKLPNLKKLRFSCGDILKAKMKRSITKLRSRSFHENMLSKKKDTKIKNTPNLDINSESVRESYSSVAKTSSINQTPTHKDAVDSDLATTGSLEVSYISLSSGTEEPMFSDSEDSSDDETVSGYPQTSALKSNSKLDNKKRTVTFNNTSCIIINDSDDSLCALPTKSKLLSQDRSVCEVTSTTSTSAQKSSIRSLYRPRISSDSSLIIRKSKAVGNKPSFNLSSSGSTNKNGNTTSKSSQTSEFPKRTRMPNFAKIHQKLFSNMLDIKQHSEKKAQRAQELLSGQKSIATLSKQGSTAAKKKLDYTKEIPTTSVVLRQNNKHLSMGSKNINFGMSRFGFKSINKKEAISKDNQAAVANKIKPLKSSTREMKNEIKGVRSNRRFELLMKMRKKQF